jgi:aryl-phospho-beta-D-glucosidase BglC (GH1 family)
MKKWLCGCAIVLLLAFTSCPPSDPDDGEKEYNTAYEYFQGKNLRAGWNIGNSLDAPNETQWGNPRISQTLLNGVKKAGFDVVRIPITWTTKIGAAPDYTINGAYLERVAEVAGYAKNAGLVAIINMHHDGSSNGTSDSWLSIRKALADENDYAEITAKYKSVWQQIAARFKDHGDYLIFEAFNELHDGGWFWETRNVPKEQYDVINEWNQVFTDTVRGAGGNNAKRFLVIPGYCTGPEALLSNNFDLPVDTATGKQIVSFHYYRPDGFALNGNSATWGSTSEKTAISTLFGRIKEVFIDYEIPVIIGETGPVKNKADTDAARQARIDYASYMFGNAAANGLVPIYWDNGNFGTSGEVFGLINRTTGQPQNAECAAVIEAMIEAVK